MLKTWLNLLVATTCASLLLPDASSQENHDGIIFLHLRRDQAGLTLLDADSRPGRFKAQPSEGSLGFEVFTRDSAVIHAGALSDPLLEPVEYPDAFDPFLLRKDLPHRDSAQFTLRLPASTSGKSIKFFRRPVSGRGPISATGTQEFLTEIAIPERPARLSASAASARLHTLLTNGPTGVRLNIAILAEGFTAAEETTFTNRASIVLNQFLGTSPYKEYRNHFNGFAIFVPSNQSGSDHPTSGTDRNTYFNSSYGEGSLVRLITIPPNNWNPNYNDGQGKVSSLLQQFVPEYDIALLLVNDTEYGGSGGFPAIASIHSSSDELALHEIGHSFANLGDEYDTPAPGYPEVEHANTTRETRRAMIKWRNWILPSTPIPTPETSPYASVVGLFEGAYFHETGWFRPKLDCRMKTLDREFCEVCKETIVLSTYSRLDLIQSSSPIDNNPTVPGGGEILLSVDAVKPTQTALAYTWTIDGVTNMAYSSASFPASFSTLGVGNFLVRVSVNDPTPLVRTDPSGKLWQTRSWLVRVLGSSNQPPSIPPIPDVQSMAVDSTILVPFRVTDPDTPIESITLSVRSANTNLVADSDLRLSGTGTNRTISIPTRCEVFGTSTITVFANDGDNIVSNTFTLHVNGNSLATLSPIPDQKAFAGPIVIPVQIDYGGCNTLSVFAESSNAALLPTTNIVVQGSGTNRLLRLNPTPNQSGSSRITVRVFDGEILTSVSFDVIFLKPPVVTAETPSLTSDGIRLRFLSNTETSMVLEYSIDFRFWSPLISGSNTSSLEFLIPKPTLAAKGFYRLRLLPL